MEKNRNYKKKQRQETNKVCLLLFFIFHLAIAANLLIDRRCQFLDLMAVLHGSFRHSPYLRLPLLGVSVNKELSFVRPALSEKLLDAKDKKAVEKVLSDFGKKLAEHTLAETSKEMLQKRPC